MSAAAFNKSFQNVSKMAGFYDLPMGKKSITAIRNVICLTTDAKSLNSSNKFVEYLFKVQDNLPTQDIDKKVIKILDQALTSLNEALSKVNDLLNTVSNIFDNSGESDIEIDDQNMIQFLANMQKSQNLLIYVTDYLSFYIEVQNSKNEENQVCCTFDELISKIIEEAA